jgi:hypothetical protein
MSENLHFDTLQLKIRLKKSKKSKRIKGKKEGRRGTNIRGLANGVIWGTVVQNLF